MKNNNNENFFDSVLDLMYEEKEITLEYEDTPELRHQAFENLIDISDYMNFLKKEIKREIPTALISALMGFYFTHQFANVLHAQGFESVFTYITGALLLACDATLLYSTVNTYNDLVDYGECKDEKDICEMILCKKD